MKKIKLSIILCCLLGTALAQPLERRAHIGVRFSGPNGIEAGTLVRSVESSSAWRKAGLRVDDKLIRLNGELIKDPDRWSDVIYDLRGGQQVALEVVRNGELIKMSVKLEPLPRETYPDTEVHYQEVMSDQGDLIRTIVTHPKKADGPLPAVFVIGGLSCSSIEVYPGRRESGWTRVLRDLSTKSGMVVMRVEKPGVGDSNGHCGESDLQRDLAAFEAAFKSLRNFKLTDTTKMVIYGSSMGSALAPYFANKLGAAAVISDGTFVKTWFEHMLEIERRIRAFEGDSPTEVMRKMNEGYIPLYHGMLIKKMSYEEVIQQQPSLKAYNYHSPEHMYGRPVSYYHQVQDFNFSKNWEELKVPARIIYGSNDWIMTANDNDMIMDILENTGHKDHKLIILEGVDHWNMVHEKALDSYQGKTGTWDDKISQTVIDAAWELILK
ncbi:PDZ domain-containing protein [Fulvivirga sp. M361]|uniref:PDZ domain-containing protein n=1 Tax=Fulvivirga sp. M361 TaxID=2594266 RepID=UPI00117ABE70|nr:PDZ domain-containing protein [Fulvivirga sp. M361]TRX62639.1 PDZ domain-containing protein [Fulvivirga sp. M361]